MIEPTRLEEAAAAELFVNKASKTMDLDEYKALLAMDPTLDDSVDFDDQRVGKFTQWLLVRYNEIEKSRLNAAHVKGGLGLFAKLSRNNTGKKALHDLFSFIPIEQVADIQKYSAKDIVSLYAKRNKLAGEEIPLERRVEVLFNGEKLFVVKPLTHEASRKYGTGTSWCTATSTEYYFNSYSRSGGLYIIIDKEHPESKWQIGRRGREFADKGNRQLSPRGFLYSMAERGEQYKDEADKVAEIFGDYLGYTDWAPYALVLSPLTQQILDKIEKGDEYSIHRTRIDGWSAMAVLLRQNELFVAESVHEAYGAMATADDFLMALHNQNEQLLRLLSTYTSSADMLDALVRLGRGGGYLLDKVEGALARDMLTRLGEELPLKNRAELLLSARGGLFSPTRLQEVVAGKPLGAIEEDDLYKDLIEAIFPEIKATTLQEAYYFDADAEELADRRRQQVVASLKKRTSVGLLGVIKEKLRRIFNPVKAWMPSTWLLLTGETLTIQAPEQDSLKVVVQSILDDTANAAKIIKSAARKAKVSCASPQCIYQRYLAEALEDDTYDWTAFKKYTLSLVTSYCKVTESKPIPYAERNRIQEQLGELLLWTGVGNLSAYRYDGWELFQQTVMAEAANGASSNLYSLRKLTKELPPGLSDVLVQHAAEGVKEGDIVEKAIASLDSSLDQTVDILGEIGEMLKALARMDVPDLAKALATPITKFMPILEEKEMDYHGVYQRGVLGELGSTVGWFPSISHLNGGSLFLFSWNFPGMSIANRNREAAMEAVASASVAHQVKELMQTINEAIEVILQKLAITSPHIKVVEVAGQIRGEAIPHEVNSVAGWVDITRRGWLL